MKKIILSAAVAALAFSTSAVAADKGIDIVTTGQAVVYYETNKGNQDGDVADLFHKDASKANVGVQLNLGADLKNGFTFGSQLTYLGTAGLEGNLVSATTQNVGGAVDNNSLTDEIALTKFFIAKKIGNTTVKIGRQELPKSLSPMAFSEGWNVFKNTFEAVLVLNSDVPDTLLVGAYVSGSNASNGDLGNFNNLGNTDNTDTTTTGGAYMLTVQNKSIPMATVTASYYDVAKLVGKDGVTVFWGNVAIADKSFPMGLKVGIQGATLDTDTAGYADTSLLGIKASIKPIKALTLAAAYTSVDGDDNKINASLQNVGTGVKTALYTQMVGNQAAIATDANTLLLKAAYNTGAYGTIILQAGLTEAGKSNTQNRVAGVENDYTEIDLMYKIKAGGVNFFAAYVDQSWDQKVVANNKDHNSKVRVWARYNF